MPSERRCDASPTRSAAEAAECRPHRQPSGFRSRPRNHILSVALWVTVLARRPSRPILQTGPGHNREVAAAHRRPQKGDRAGAAHSAPCRRRDRDRRQLPPVAVLQPAQAGPARRYRESRQPADDDRRLCPIPSDPASRCRQPGFRSCRTPRRGIVPTLIAGFGSRRNRLNAAMIDKRVDRAGPAKDLAPRMIDFPAIKMRFRVATVHPVDSALMERDSVTDWHATQKRRSDGPQATNRISTACRRFHQNTAGRSTADNDVVKFLHPLPHLQDTILRSS